jgi:hypothetical protein
MPNRKLVVYIAGPMTSLPKYNFPAFFKAEQRLKKLGYKVVNPARMDVQAGDVTRGGVLKRHLSVRQVVKRDMDAIIDNCDCILLLPGWKLSRGARAERAVAEWLGLSILPYSLIKPKRRKK